MNVLIKTLMQFGVAMEVELFWKACLLGVVLGIVFEIGFALRRLINHSSAAVFAEDFLYVCLFSFVFYIYCQMCARGELRGFILFGMIAGAVLEHSTLGTIFNKLVLTPIVFVKKEIIKMLLKPVKFIRRKLCAMFRKIKPILFKKIYIRNIIKKSCNKNKNNTDNLSEKSLSEKSLLKKDDKNMVKSTKTALRKNDKIIHNKPNLKKRKKSLKTT